MLVICILMIWASSALCHIVHISDNELNLLPGYARNFTPANPAWRSRLVRDQDKEIVTFCDSYQQETIQYPSWPRLKAFPGAEVFLAYSAVYENLGEEGEIILYGTMEFQNPDTRKFSEYFDGGNGIYELQRRSYRAAVSSERSSFKVPEDFATSGPYALYWMWNTTTLSGDKWVIYTSCFDLDIIVSTEPESTPYSKLPTTNEKVSTTRAGISRHTGLGGSGFKGNSLIPETPTSKSTKAQTFSLTSDSASSTANSNLSTRKCSVDWGSSIPEVGLTYMSNPPVSTTSPRTESTDMPLTTTPQMITYTSIVVVTV